MTNEKIEKAVEDFNKLTIMTSADGDEFFEKYGAGNTMDDISPECAYVKFQYYEKLLSRLRKEDEKKYKLIHKGTPFYFLAWLAFDLRNFQSTNFYMSQAITPEFNPEVQHVRRTSRDEVQ